MSVTVVIPTCGRSIGSPPPRASVAPSGLGQRLARLEGWIERDRVGLTAADLTPAQVEAITDAVRQAADHGDHVTPDQLTAGFTSIRAEHAPLDNWSQLNALAEHSRDHCRWPEPVSARVCDERLLTIDDERRCAPAHVSRGVRTRAERATASRQYGMHPALPDSEPPQPAVVAGNSVP